ncbi:MAG: outer membrane protein assembly factor BamD [Candidatus Omnitrophica bacterium]|nr:outer membrane protein assembly factor BamD [Candidatus Omnitrophota bacterium]
MIKLAMMNKTINILILILLSFLFGSVCHAFWIWTPETNKWVNPKYAVKDTPFEQLSFGTELFNSGKYDEAVREFRKLIRHFPKAVEAPEAQFFVARSLEEQKKLFEAFKEYQLVIDKYPFSERSGEIVEKQYNLGLKLLDGKLGKSGFKDFMLGRDYDPIEILRAVIKNSPYSKYAPASQYKIGLYLLEKGLYQESRDEFEKLINDYPASEEAKLGKYQIALADTKRSTEAPYDQKVTENALKELEEASESYPEADLSEQAQQNILKLKEKEAESNFIIAQFYEKQKQFESAKIYYRIVADNYQNTKWAAKALERIQTITQGKK